MDLFAVSARNGQPIRPPAVLSSAPAPVFSTEVVAVHGVDESTASEQARAQAFVDLGFDSTQALMLAATRDEGEHVEPGDVRRLLDAGCPHELALRILV